MSAKPVSCRVEQPSSAKPAAVYDALMDVDRWSDWMPTVSAASWQRRGEPETGLGGIRRVRNRLNVVHDRVVDGARPHHHVYDATLPATCSSRTPRIPALAKPIQSRLRSIYLRLAAALAHEAERQQ